MKRASPTPSIAPGILEIGYDNVDGCARPENGNSLVAIDRFDDPEALFAERVGNVKTHQKFIVHHKHGRR
jgi:hypothetical protein